jgi:hypothetical protein
MEQGIGAFGALRGCDRDPRPVTSILRFVDAVFGFTKQSVWFCEPIVDSDSVLRTPWPAPKAVRWQ